MKLRRFNPAGLDRFSDYVAALRADKTLPAPFDLLEDDALTEVVAPATDCPDASFANRLAAAEYLDRVLTPSGLADAFADVGLWAWLALRFFDQLCPIGKDGSRSPGEDARWIPQVDGSRRYYRHLLLGPSVIYQAHRDEPERVVGLLADPVSIGTSEVFRLFIENPSLIRSRSAVAAATALYYDPVKKKNRRGIGAKDAGAGGKAKPGTVRRLIAVLQQFDCTYDLYALSPAVLLDMLPSEFDRYQPEPMLVPA